MEAKESQSAESKQRYYNLAQVFLFKFMVLEGTVKDWPDYINRIAPIFELLANGTMEYNEPDVLHLRSQINNLTQKV